MNVNLNLSNYINVDVFGSYSGSAIAMASDINVQLKLSSNMRSCAQSKELGRGPSEIVSTF